ncbi:MAG TPA: sulfocyanin-like copper-binding protein [Acidimicrobiia bacterium]|nr:sulfocyanin-like copper-binding protein [Acidimicrobiia bacterium]
MTQIEVAQQDEVQSSGRHQVAPGSTVAPTVVAALVILFGCVVALGLGVLARHHANSEEFKGSEKIVVHERSFRITLSRTTVNDGKIGFDVHNDASIGHEFVVFKTDLPADQLPLGKDGDVIEDSPELKDVVDSGSALKPGSSRALFAHLEAGHYAVVCNLPGHYHDGMHLDLVVRQEPSGS